MLAALAIVPSESAESYEFLFNSMKLNPGVKEFLSQPALLILSDRSKGADKAVRTVFDLRSQYHRHCALHILGNFKTKALSSTARQKYWRMVRAPTHSEFVELFEEFRALAPEAAKYLEEELAPKEYATYTMGTAGMWEIITSNLAERAMHALRDFRGLTATSFFKNYLLYLARIFESRHKKDRTRNTTLSLFACSRIHRLNASNNNYTCVPTGGMPQPDGGIMYQVFVGGRATTSSSNQDARKVRNYEHYWLCSCLVTHGLPCRHVHFVLKANDRTHEITNESTARNFVHPSYLMQSVLDAYANTFIDACLEEDLDSTACNPPAPVACSDNKRRIRSNFQKHTGATNGVQSKKCSNCHEYGHTLRSCKYERMSTDDAKLHIQLLLAQQQASASCHVREQRKPVPVEVTHVKAIHSVCAASPASFSQVHTRNHDIRISTATAEQQCLQVFEDEDDEEDGVLSELFPVAESAATDHDADA